MKKKKSTDLGANRTGAGTAPVSAPRTAQGSQARGATSGGDFASRHADVHRAYLDEREPVGTMPPPSTLKGMGKTALDMVKGMKSTVLLDKLGERIAFERTGTRLYDGLLLKLDLHGSFDGGPSRDDLLRIRNEEHQHFLMLSEAMTRLGADPTAMTPSADLAAVESLGVEKVIADVRTTLPEALHAIQVAELVDLEAWDALIDVARAFGQDDLVERCRRAEQEEARHVASVRAWTRAWAMSEAGASTPAK